MPGTPIRSSFAAVVVLPFALACRTAAPLVHDDSPVAMGADTLPAPNPSRPGSFAVRRLYYGSAPSADTGRGSDTRRPEYRDSLTLRTKTVDASPFMAGVDAKVARNRKKYWHFDFAHFPVNARVWYPDGAGPFPLVLIVHGNHDMKKFSDPGYAYLGEMLASRGFIVASVDENFLNGAIGTENDARGWMLLQHLVWWRKWNAGKGNPFEGKVDLDRIALIGHSRGGEAVAVASAFNNLSHYPDDATVTFDFHFHIRAVIAIAPIDGQYQPTDRLTPLENVDYFVIHGSHDADVSTFVGMRPFQRLKFTDGQAHVKAALFIWRANHGQWNTVWGDNDVGDYGWLLDRQILLTGPEQRQIGALYIAGMLEFSLHERREYLPMFRDHRTVAGWLPRTMYLSRFEEPTLRYVADFEDDIDVTTASLKGATLAGDGLDLWKEGVLMFRWAGTRQNNNAVWLGWNRRDTTAATTSAAAASAPTSAAAAAAPADSSVKPKQPPRYTITLPDTLAAAWRLTPESQLVFSLADLGSVPPHKKTPADSTAAARADSAAKAAPKAAKPEKKPAAKPPRDTLPVDLTVELETATGVRADVPLSKFGPVRRPITVRVLRWWWLDRRLYGKPNETMLQTFSLPLSAFVAAEPKFDPRAIRAIRFRFDRATGGTVILDNVGFDTAPAGR